MVFPACLAPACLAPACLAPAAATRLTNFQSVIGTIPAVHTLASQPPPNTLCVADGSESARGIRSGAGQGGARGRQQAAAGAGGCSGGEGRFFSSSQHAAAHSLPGPVAPALPAGGGWQWYPEGMPTGEGNEARGDCRTHKISVMAGMLVGLATPPSLLPPPFSSLPSSPYPPTPPPLQLHRILQWTYDHCDMFYPYRNMALSKASTIPLTQPSHSSLSTPPPSSDTPLVHTILLPHTASGCLPPLRPPSPSPTQPGQVRRGRPDPRPTSGAEDDSATSRRGRWPGAAGECGGSS